MAKYRRKPEVREAEQWFPGKDVPGVFVEDLKTPAGNPHPLGRRYFVVTTHGQWVYLAPGDYVVTEPDGRGHYPCKPDIWEAENDLLPDPLYLPKCVLRKCPTSDLCGSQRGCEASTMKLG